MSRDLEAWAGATSTLDEGDIVDNRAERCRTTTNRRQIAGRNPAALRPSVMERLLWFSMVWHPVTIVPGYDPTEIAPLGISARRRRFKLLTDVAYVQFASPPSEPPTHDAPKRRPG